MNSTEVRKERFKEFKNEVLILKFKGALRLIEERVDKDYYQKGRKRKRRKRTCQKVQSGSKNLRNEKEKKSHLI